MKKEILAYIAEVEMRLRTKDNINEAFLSELLTRIGFYQHERLVHLIVTMTFAIMTVISIFMLVTAYTLAALLLSLLFLSGIVVHETRKYLWRNRLDECDE